MRTKAEIISLLTNPGIIAVVRAQKPEQVIPRIVEGQIEAFLKQGCLMEQEYFRDPGHTVQELIAENISKLQENITVRRFARFNIRET